MKRAYYMNWPEMSEHSTDNEVEVVETRVDFGQALLHAREQAGISIEHVAEELNLPEKTVKAIENSDMSLLPPAAFVRGYIRAYAKVIDFDVEKLLRDFDTSVPNALEPELHPLSSLPLETSSQNPLIQVVTVLIAVFAVLALIYGAYNYYSRKSEDMEQAAVTDAGKLQLPPEAPLGIERDVNNENTALTSVNSEETQAEAESIDEPAIVVTETEHETQAMAVPASEQAKRPEPAVQQSAADDSAVEQATDGDVLVLEASAESWAEIRDAAGKRKFYGLLDQGRTRKLTGVAPFDIFLGNAPAVSVTLNNIRVDMTKHTRSNNIAHFKVSAEDGRARIQ
jgi:cytoskeleton protein RodZ